MDHPIVFNTNSFMNASSEDTISAMTEAMYGVLELNMDEDRFNFYYDSNDGNTYEMLLAEGLTFQDYINSLGETDPDLQLFIYEAEDKSPALDYLTDERIEEWSSYTYYIPGEPALENGDVIGLTWLLSGCLVSLNLCSGFTQSKVNISRADENGKYVSEEVLYVRNISCREHGVEIYRDFNKESLLDICNQVIVSKQLENWFLRQTRENRSRVSDKVKYACEKGFIGGEPLFKKLNDKSGMREIRFDAFPGGTIRILYKAAEGVQYLLDGFIKKNDGEGYGSAIKRAKKALEELNS